MQYDSNEEKEMNWSKNGFTIATDKSLLDIQVIHGFLKSSYWGASRTIEQIERSIDYSICFGLYQDGRQIGFARLITDEVVITSGFTKDEMPLGNQGCTRTLRAIWLEKK